MQVLIGFVIALFVGLTGIGGGSFTTPALILIAGVSGSEAVGTALAFATIIKLIAAPFYILGKQVHMAYLRLMMVGALPGLIAGTYFLHIFNVKQWSPFILAMIGLMLIVSASATLIFTTSRVTGTTGRPRWLPWLALPIGVETGFSSAGAGALGTILLLNSGNISTAQAVGTDLIFGIVLAGAGALFHFSLGSMSAPILKQLLLGGVPGVLLGCFAAPAIPARKIRGLILLITICLGSQLIWTGIQIMR
jgi:uncharacterized protein